MLKQNKIKYKDIFKKWHFWVITIVWIIWGVSLSLSEGYDLFILIIGIFSDFFFVWLTYFVVVSIINQKNKRRVKEK